MQPTAAAAPVFLWVAHGGGSDDGVRLNAETIDMSGHDGGSHAPIEQDASSTKKKPAYGGYDENNLV